MWKCKCKCECNTATQPKYAIGQKVWITEYAATTENPSEICEINIHPDKVTYELRIRNETYYSSGTRAEAEIHPTRKEAALAYIERKHAEVDTIMKTMATLRAEIDRDFKEQK